MGEGATGVRPLKEVGSGADKERSIDVMMPFGLPNLSGRVHKFVSKESKDTKIDLVQ